MATPRIPKELHKPNSNEGRRHVPTDQTRRMVQALVANGLRHDQIGFVLDITDRTLEKYYAKELAQGFDRIYAAISSTLVKQALSGDKACMIFWLKARAGWREVTRSELSNPDGSALDLTKLSTKEIVAALEATGPAPVAGAAGARNGADTSESR